MLSGILKLLRESGTLSIQEIGLALQVDSSALRPMLEMLEQKGKVVKVEIPCKKACTGGCTESDTMTFYKLKNRNGE